MAHRKYFNACATLLLLSSLTGCASWIPWATKEPEKQVVTETKYVTKNIPLQPRPRALDLQDMKFYVVTADNLEEFMQRFEQEQGQLVFFAMSVPDYERLAMNMADIKRYIEQQKSIIVYYESAISEDQKEQQKK
jgi:hypothetical protein